MGLLSSAVPVDAEAERCRKKTTRRLKTFCCVGRSPLMEGKGPPPRKSSIKKLQQLPRLERGQSDLPRTVPVLVRSVLPGAMQNRFETLPPHSPLRSPGSNCKAARGSRPQRARPNARQLPSSRLSQGPAVGPKKDGACSGRFWAVAASGRNRRRTRYASGTRVHLAPAASWATAGWPTQPEAGGPLGCADGPATVQPWLLSARDQRRPCGSPPGSRPGRLSRLAGQSVERPGPAGRFTRRQGFALTGNAKPVAQAAGPQGGWGCDTIPGKPWPTENSGFPKSVAALVGFKASWAITR